MTTDQITILVLIAATAALFIWGRWRHDIVALAALVACVAFGLVPGETAFEGFGHPAVISVAAILILSQGLQVSGAIDALTDRILPSTDNPMVMIAALSTLAAVLSSFMNNVGALALLMPIGLQVAHRTGVPPGRVLMPMAFTSVLGGMTTLIGTPPNLIVSGFRAEELGQGYRMFDFAPVGLSVAAVGVAFIVLIGWRWVPNRKGTSIADFDAGAYQTEVVLPKAARAIGMTLRAIDAELGDTEAQVIAIIRNDVRMEAPSGGRKVRPDDILVVEADPKALSQALVVLGGTIKDAGKGHSPGEEVVLREIAILPSSSLNRRSARSLRLRTTFGINLLALSRQGRRSQARLRTSQFQAGDVLLMQGTADAIAEFAAQYGCVPLAERQLRLPNRGRAIAAGGIMVASVGLAASGLLPAAIAFALGVLAVVAFRVIPTSRIYDAIDWPVIVLLGALMPIAGAMETTGAADVLARAMLESVARGNAVVALGVILVVTMFLSDFMNNAATAAIMCPIAISTAASLGVSIDPFLMAVVVGASCAFLTPIGHQNNTLILGPGGFRFGDYWQLGLPLEVIVVIVGLPMILVVWPL